MQLTKLVSIQQASYDSENRRVTLDNTGIYFNDSQLNSYGNENSKGISIITSNKPYYIADISPDLVSILDKLNQSITQLVDLANTVPVEGVPLSPQIASNLQSINQEVEALKDKLR